MRSLYGFGTVLLILLLAFFLRTYQLDRFPPSLNWDEVSLGYNSYSILKTAHDEWGEFMPLSFRAYGDYKLPGYIYLDTLFVSILGLNVWGVRALSILSGLGTVGLIYLIVFKFTQDRLSSTVGMFLGATTPWLLIMSRIALEANLALLFVTLGVYLSLLGIKKNWYLLAANLFFGLAIFTYNSSRVMVLPLVLLILFLFKKNLTFYKLPVILSLLLLSAFFIIAAPLALLQDSSARYHWTTILDEGAIDRIDQLRGSSALPPLLDKVIYNKVTYFVPQAVGNYFSHFSSNFLFVNGSSNFQYSIPGSGLLFLITLPFLLLGILQIFVKPAKELFLILAWLLVAPIPAAITRDSPHALRALSMVVPLLIFISVGYHTFEKLFKKKLLLLVMVLVVTIYIANFYAFWQNYTHQYVQKYSWSWQYGYQQAIEYALSNKSSYQHIIFSKKYGEPHEFVLFYSQYQPLAYFNNPNLIRYGKSDWFWVDRFDKYLFINDWEIKEKTANFKDALLITSPGNYPKRATFLTRINFLDGSPAFDIVKL